MLLPSGIYHQVPLDTSEIPQSDLNIEDKMRSNPLAWTGQFSPQLVQVLLAKYADGGTRVFDPFLGSGTVLLEAGRAGLAACGTEINPAAVYLSQTYRFINMPPALRHRHLEAVQMLLKHHFFNRFPLFQAHRGVPQEGDRAKTPLSPAELLSLVQERPQQQLLETLITLLNLRDSDVAIDDLFATWSRLSRLVASLPYSEEPIEVYLADARKTPLADGSVNLVVTSPPYINVFNYHQQYRAAVEALNWHLLRIAQSEIGSNRKHRGNRFLTVIQYCLDMAQTFHELARVCRPEARLIFIVGRESTVRGTPIFNGEIVAEIAHRALKFRLLLRQERVYLNRFGQHIFEDVLHFSPPMSGVPADFIANAREIARTVLESAHPIAPEKARDDIKTAIEKLETVSPSPLFEASVAKATRVSPSREMR